MPHRNASQENNRSNDDNQTSRHHHTKGAGSTFPSSKEIESQEQEVNQPHEYYPDFDKTGKGINPDDHVGKNSR